MIPSRPGDWTGLNALDEDALKAVLLANLDQLLDGHLDRPEDENAALAQLPAALRTLWYLNWLEFELTQGSLEVYLTNSHGRHAHDASEAFRRIGAYRSAVALGNAIVAASAAALAQQPANPGANDYPEDRPVDSLVIDSPDEDQIEAFTDDLRTAMNDDRWGDLLGVFLTRSATEITEWAVGA